MLEIGAIHTYIELYARLYVDLTPNIVLVASGRFKADRAGNPLHRRLQCPNETIPPSSQFSRSVASAEA